MGLWAPLSNSIRPRCPWWSWTQLQPSPALPVPVTLLSQAVTASAQHDFGKLHTLGEIQLRAIEVPDNLFSHLPPRRVLATCFSSICRHGAGWCWRLLFLLSPATRTLFPQAAAEEGTRPRAPRSLMEPESPHCQRDAGCASLTRHPRHTSRTSGLVLKHFPCQTAMENRTLLLSLTEDKKSLPCRILSALKNFHKGTC